MKALEAQVDTAAAEAARVAALKALAGRKALEAQEKLEAE
jgi:hypothetical protein